MTFYFYDLETSGVSPRAGRIMQFAGQRTNENLESIGEPDVFYIRLNRDVLPEPDAILLTGITPQKTLQDGITEAEFIKYFEDHIATPSTVFVGFNNLRFDDEFIRFTMWRNYADPYEWAWKDGRSRWDILDVVRMTRALRPEGIKWPTDSEGKASNRLELLTKFNDIDHKGAHDALSDVLATISVAKLIKDKQPKLFEHLLGIRGKKEVQALALSGKPFVYVSGRYDSAHEKLSVVATVAETSRGDGAIVFDLRRNPEEWAKKSDEELAKALNEWHDEAAARLPFKIMKYNHCPAIAPAGVIGDQAGRLDLDWKIIEAHTRALKDHPDLVERVLRLFEEKEKSYQTALIPDERFPDERLYDGFVPDSGRREAEELRNLSPDKIKDYKPHFEDGRLNGLFNLYKARNYPKLLTSDERGNYEHFTETKLFAGSPSAMEKFYERLSQLMQQKGLTKNQLYVLEELKLYAESLAPADL